MFRDVLLMFFFVVEPISFSADWRLFDDSIVSKQSVSNVQSDDAYLLFYKQRGLPTRSIFR